jgi:hypothetical protein
MRTLAGSVKRFAVAAAFGAMACEVPDKSSLYEPLEPGPVGAEEPGMGAAPEAPPEDADNGLDTGASGNAGKEGTPPISGPLLPAVEPAASEADAGLSPAPPNVPSVDAAAPNEPLAPDAGNEPVPPLEPECGGALLDGICWYLGGAGEACNDVCATRGGFEPAATAWVGTPAQGGSIESCTAVLSALGELPGLVTEGFREDELGLGCHIFLDAAAAASAWWLTAPEFSPAAFATSARLACGCLR